MASVTHTAAVPGEAGAGRAPSPTSHASLLLPSACCFAVANCLHPSSDKRLKAQITPLQAMKTKRDPIAANSRAAPAAEARSVGKVVCIDQRPLPPTARLLQPRRWGKRHQTPREFPERQSPANGRSRKVCGIGVRSQQRAMLLLHTVLSWHSHQGNASLGDKQQCQGHTDWSDAEPWEVAWTAWKEAPGGCRSREELSCGWCWVCRAPPVKSHLWRVEATCRRPQESSAVG